MKFVRAIAVLILLIGVGVIAYPYVSQWLYDRESRELAKEFDDAFGVDNLSVGHTVLDELYELLVKENEELYLSGQSDLKEPFSYEVAGIDLSEYGIKDNMIGYLDIPTMDLMMPIYLGANNANMNKGAVHLTETSYPVGGPNTNVVIAAHRGHPQKKMFKEIDILQIGDPVYIVNFRERLEYKVVETKIILPTDLSEIFIQDGRELVTLISCHPYGNNYQRYVVYCERVNAD